MVSGLIILIILLVALTLLSASLSAFSSMLPEDIDKLLSVKKKNARTVLSLSNKSGRLSKTIYVAIYIINTFIIILTVFLGTFFVDLNSCGVLCFLIEALIILILFLLFGKMIPELIRPQRNLSFAMFMAAPLAVLEILLRPLTILLENYPSSEIRKHNSTGQADFNPDDLSEDPAQVIDSLSGDDKILEGIVNFGNINVSKIMCPRIDVTAIDIRSEFNQVIHCIINSGFSRIPVYSETFDNVKGILYAKDILPFMSNPGNFNWQSLLRETYFVPETKKINDLLKEFQIKKIHMAVVIDEYGGNSGIVTLEDILEEIVGEITDESDEDKVPYRKTDDNTYIFEGKILLDEIVEILNLHYSPFEDIRGESETLAGLILEITGEIPEQGQIIRFKNFIFTITSADRRRIKEVRVEIKDDNDKPEEK